MVERAQEPSRTVLDQMRKAWKSDRCVCGNLKRDSQDWFCKGCWWSLPKDTRKALTWKPWKSAAYWLQAMAILKQDREK